MEEKLKEAPVPCGILKKGKNTEGEPVVKSIAFSKSVTFGLHNNEVLIFTPESESDLNDIPHGSEQPIDTIEEEFPAYVLNAIKERLVRPIVQSNPTLECNMVEGNVTGLKISEVDETNGDDNQVAIEMNLLDQMKQEVNLDQGYISYLNGMLYKFGMNVAWTTSDYFRHGERMIDLLRRRYELQMLRTLFPKSIVDMILSWAKERKQRKTEEKRALYFHRQAMCNSNYILINESNNKNSGCFPNNGRAVGTGILIVFVLFMTYVLYQHDKTE